MDEFFYIWIFRIVFSHHYWWCVIIVFSGFGVQKFLLCEFFDSVMVVFKLFLGVTSFKVIFS